LEPLIVEPAQATPSISADGTVLLSVLADDDQGESNLTYAWSVVGNPPGNVVFSTNDSNAAKHTVANLDAVGDYQLRVVVVDLDGNSAESTVVVSRRDYVARYKADETGGATLYDDSPAHNDASLSGSFSFSAGQLDNALNLGGGFAELPAGIVSDLRDFTIAAWVKPSRISAWARIFDFGDDTTNYMFLTPLANTGRPRFAIRTPSVGEQIVDSSVTLPSGVWSHVAVSLSGTTARLYVDGVLRGSNPGTTLTPADLGETSANYLGKSQWPDPAFLGSIDEFRIYSRALSTAEIQSLASLPTHPGDFDGDQRAAGSDFLLWQRTLASTTNLSADGDRNLVVDRADLTLWEQSFGTSATSLATSVLSVKAQLSDDSEPLAGIGDVGPVDSVALGIALALAVLEPTRDDLVAARPNTAAIADEPLHVQTAAEQSFLASAEPRPNEASSRVRRPERRASLTEVDAALRNTLFFRSQSGRSTPIIED
ncbi:MAG: hypothetical protein KDA61_11650, partial [Planctomycetales bacterium]|nr:hypothetical protein [Planctomycetales bacterium]